MKEAFVDGPTRGHKDSEAMDRAGSFKRFEVNIIKLKLVTEDELTPTDNNRDVFKSKAITGPAEVQLVRPLRDLFISSNNDGIFYSRAFKLLKQNKTLQRCETTWLIKGLLKKIEGMHEMKDPKFTDALEEMEQKAKEADEKTGRAIRRALGSARGQLGLEGCVEEREKRSKRLESQWVC